MSTTSTGK
jgi:hypothetical protein